MGGKGGLWLLVMMMMMMMLEMMMVVVVVILAVVRLGRYACSSSSQAIGDGGARRGWEW